MKCFVEFGLKVERATVETIDTIKNIPIASIKSLAALAGLSFGFFELTKDVLDATNNLSDFKSQTGLSTDEMQRWISVAKQLGISTDAVQGGIQRISRAIGSLGTISPDVGFLQFLAQMGVSYNGQSADQLFRQIITSAKGMDRQRATSILAQGGLSPDLMRIVGLSPQQLNSMMNVPTISEPGIKAMNDFQMALGRMTTTIQNDLAKPLTEMAPYMGDIARALGVIVAKSVGFFGKGVGEDARLFNEINKQGGFMKFLDNLFNASLTPEDLRNKSILSTFNQTVTVNNHGVTDPQEAGEATRRAIQDSHARALRQSRLKG